METVGFIGLGNMGGGMAGNIQKAGYPMVVHDLNEGATRPLLEAGAHLASSPADVASQCDVTFTSLPGPREVEAVAVGLDGVLQGGKPGSVYIDLSTSRPTLIRELEPRFREKGIHVLDAPVSGGKSGAQTRNLAVMVGGDKATFDKFKPTLEAIGTNVIYCGEIGNGSVCKICNNLMSMGTGVLLAEALTLGVKAGVDLETLADVINNSTGGSKRLKDKFPLFLFKGNFEPGFATALAAKDVRLATDLGREYGIPMELSNMVDQRHVEALFLGYGPEDSDAVAKIQEDKSGIQLRLHD